MRRTLRFRTCDDDSILLEADTLAYRLHAGYELSAAELDVLAGTKVRIELVDGSDHLLDRRTFVVAAAGRQPPSQQRQHPLELSGHVDAFPPDRARALQRA